MSPKQAVIYIRVSTTEQVEFGTSLDNQEKACLGWAYRNNMIPIRVFRDEGKSAKTLNRPEMQAMLDYLNKNAKEIDYLVVYQLDRLTRNNYDFADLMRLLGTYGIELRDSTSSLEPGESDELLQTLQVALARQDNKIKAKRVTDNMKRQAKEGYRMHMAPYGLLNVRDSSNRATVTAKQPEAEKIAYLLTSFASGLFSKAQLLYEARSIGLTQKNGKEMSYQFLDKILRQPLYAGFEKSSLTNWELVQSTYAGIVPEWVFITNQQLLEKDASRKKDGYLSANPDYPLRRFVTCIKCGSALRGSASTGRAGKKYPRYHCTTQSCHSAFITPQELHSLFTVLLGDLVPEKGRIKLLQVVIMRVWKDEVKNMRSRRRRLQVELDSISDKKFKIAEKALSNDLTRQERDILNQRLDGRAAEIKIAFNKLDDNIGTKERAVNYALSYLENAPKIWSNASTEAKITFQYMVFPQGIGFDLVNKNFGTAKLSSLYTLANIKKETSVEDESLLVNHLISNWNHILSEVLEWFSYSRGVQPNSSIPL